MKKKFIILTSITILGIIAQKIYSYEVEMAPYKMEAKNILAKFNERKRIADWQQMHNDFVDLCAAKTGEKIPEHAVVIGNYEYPKDIHKKMPDILKRRAHMEKTKMFDPQAQPFMDLDNPEKTAPAIYSNTWNN